MATSAEPTLVNQPTEHLTGWRFAVIWLALLAFCLVIWSIVLWLAYHLAGWLGIIIIPLAISLAEITLGLTLDHRPPSIEKPRPAWTSEEILKREG